MSKVGRRIGFLIGTALGFFAALLCAYAVWHESFYVFVLGTFLIGNYIAFLQQFRFAVAETVPKNKIPRSLSILMLAGIVAALLGPEVGQRYSAVDGLPLYVGSFFGLAALLTISLLILLLFYRDTNVVTEVSEGAIRPARVLFKQPKLILAVFIVIDVDNFLILVASFTKFNFKLSDKCLFLFLIAFKISLRSEKKIFLIPIS